LDISAKCSKIHFKLAPSVYNIQMTTLLASQIFIALSGLKL